MCTKIECCQMNRWNGSGDVFEELARQKGIEVETFSCIGNCLVCKSKFHGIVNDKRVEGATPELLFDTITTMIEQL